MGRFYRRNTSARWNRRFKGPYNESPLCSIENDIFIVGERKSDILLCAWRRRWMLTRSGPKKVGLCGEHVHYNNMTRTKITGVCLSVPPRQRITALRKSSECVRKKKCQCWILCTPTEGSGMKRQGKKYSKMIIKLTCLTALFAMHRSWYSAPLPWSGLVSSNKLWIYVSYWASLWTYENKKKNVHVK